MASTKKNRAASDENPFRQAAARLGFFAKSSEATEEEPVVSPVAEEEDDADLFADVDFDEDDLDSVESDEDDDDLFDFEDDEDDEDDEEEDDDDDEVHKSGRDSKRIQSAAVTSEEQSAGDKKAKRALKVRAKNNPADEEKGHRNKGFHKNSDANQEEDFGDEDGDVGDADGDDDFSPNTEDNNRRPGKHKYTKSEDEEDDFGVPEAQAEFIEAVLASPYAKSIDSTDALKFLAELFGEEVAKERAVIGEMAKSFEAMADIYDKVNRLDFATNVMSEALTRILTSVQAVQGQQEEMAKSLTTVAGDVALVKSQPSGTVPVGVNPLPNRPAHNAPLTHGDVEIRPADIHRALAKAVEAHEMDTDTAAHYMSMIDSPMHGIEGTIKALPKGVQARVLNKSAN